MSTGQKQGRLYGIGDLIAGRFQVQGVYGGEGRSSMGVVYQCHDREHDRVLALKTLQDRYSSSRKIVDAFRKEALAWIHLEHHPNIVRAFWVKEFDRRMFIGCEFIGPDAAGRNTLAHFLAGDVSLRQSLIWCLQICYGMEHAFSRGIKAHRDLKPDNVLISFDSSAKITDFGLVGLRASPTETGSIQSLLRKDRMEGAFLSQAHERVVAGSPPWMAPEQFYGISEVRSDIYSFGVILYQLLNGGNLPVQPRKNDPWAVAHKTYAVSPVTGHGRPVTEVILRCLEKRRERRFRNFSEVRAAIDKIFLKEITRKTGDPPPIAPVSERLSQGGMINKGISLASLGLVEEGITRLKEGIRRDPQNAAAHYNLANALAQKGKFDEAIQEYRETILIDQDFEAAHYNLARILFKNNLLRESARQYREVVRINPGFAAAHINLGNCLMKLGEIDEAIDAFSKAIQVDRQSADAHMLIGHAFMKKEMPGEAIRAYREAVRMRPDAAGMHYALGAALLKQNSLDDAIQALGKAIMVQSDYLDAYYSIGFAFARANLLKEALHAFEEFIRRSAPQDRRVASAREMAGKVRRRLASS